jgi:hypothetical protein
MARYSTVVEDGTVYVGTAEGRIEIAPLDDVLDAVGGPAWTIQYSEAYREQFPTVDTSDEGLVVDVVDILNAMTHSEQFVQTLEAHPTAVPEEETLSPRGGLFVGKLLENLEHGLS